MKKAQLDKFIRLYREQPEDESWDRTEIAAKHFLCAVSFRVTSRYAHLNTGSVLLPPIGQYYSMFHLAVCICWLHPEIASEKLKKLKHAALKNLIRSYFVAPSSLDESFLQLMEKLQKEREWLNYSFGEFDYDFKGEIFENESNLEQQFMAVANLIHAIDTSVSKHFGISQRIRTYIADSKGDDFMDTYLTDEEQNTVSEFLLKYDLTN